MYLPSVLTIQFQWWWCHSGWWYHLLSNLLRRIWSDWDWRMDMFWTQCACGNSQGLCKRVRPVLIVSSSVQQIPLFVVRLVESIDGSSLHHRRYFEHILLLWGDSLGTAPRSAPLGWILPVFYSASFYWSVSLIANMTVLRLQLWSVLFGVFGCKNCALEAHRKSYCFVL